jgi:AraC-like DNA-binding protein
MQRLSTDALSHRDRLAFVHDFVGRHAVGMEFRPLDAENLRVEIAALQLPHEVLLAEARYSPIAGARTRALLNDGRDSYQLMIHTTEHEASVEGRTELKVAPGALMILDQSVHSSCRLPRTALKVVNLDRARLKRLVPRIDGEACYVLPDAKPGLSLFAGYAELLRRSPPQGEKAASLAAGHLYDLVALLLDGAVSGGAARNPRSLGAARLELVKREVRARLGDPGLGIESVARRQGVTPRYIQRLFEAAGTSFSDFLRERRLERAYRLLDDPAGVGERTIAAIAFDVGFCDLSTFNRAFRRRYAMTPSQVRAESLRRRG